MESKPENELQRDVEPAAEPPEVEEPEFLVSEPGPARRRETLRRVLWALPWIVFAIFIVAVGDALFTLALIGLGVIGLRELFHIGNRYRALAGPAYLTLAAVLLAAHYGDSFQVLLFAAIGFPVMFLAALQRRNRSEITVSMAFTVFGVAWIGIPFVHAILLRDLPLHGGALLIDVLVATFVADTAAYGAGRLFGSRKITPLLSPNKTLEGFIGGFIGGTMGFWFAGLYQDWLAGFDALVMGMVVAVTAAMGDLFESMIKRDLEVKETGRVFGPHGGLLDRLDAVFFSVVAGYYLARAFVY